MLKYAVVLGFMVLLACDGKSSPTAPAAPVATPPPLPPQRAVIGLEVLDARALITNRGNLVQADLRLTERGGAGAYLNIITLDVFRATGAFEEGNAIGGDDLILGLDGNNRLEANSSRDIRVTFLFRATVKRGKVLQFTVRLTDDGGNVHEVVDSIVFVKA